MSGEDDSGEVGARFLAYHFPTTHWLPSWKQLSWVHSKHCTSIIIPPHSICSLPPNKITCLLLCLPAQCLFFLLDWRLHEARDHFCFVSYLLTDLGNFSQLRQEAAAQRGEAACLKSHHHLQTEVCGWSSLLPLSEPPHVLGILVSENLNHTAHSKACVELYLQRHEKEFWLRHFENWPETFLVYKNPLWRESLLPESEEWCYTGRAGGWEMESEQKGEERGKLYLLSTCFSEQGPNARFQYWPSGDVNVSSLFLCYWKCLLWPVHSLGKTLLAFALLHFALQGQICLLLQEIGRASCRERV